MTMGPGGDPHPPSLYPTAEATPELGAGDRGHPISSSSSLYGSFPPDESGNGGNVMYQYPPHHDAQVVATIELTEMHEMKGDGYNWDDIMMAQHNVVDGKGTPTVAMLVPPGDVLPMREQDKLGGVCCGMCCDYRRAVIWSDSATMGIITFLLLTARGWEEGLVADDDVLSTTDDAFAATIYDISVEYMTRLDVFGYVTLVTSFGSCIGASLFLLWPTLLQVVTLLAVWVGGSIILVNMYDAFNVAITTSGSSSSSSGTTEPVSAIPLVVGIALTVTALLYPHVAYLREVHCGILTKETYPREERSCCCSSSSSGNHRPPKRGGGERGSLQPPPSPTVPQHAVIGLHRDDDSHHQVPHSPSLPVWNV